MLSIPETILSFQKLIDNDNNHRFKSWEHCYSYFKNDNPVLDIACLHLSFYLASWGMYRGSSFLIWKDYLIHKEVVQYLLTKKHLQDIDFLKIENNQISEIFEIINWVKNWYRINIVQVNGSNQSVNVTNTLVTKILLGTLGCIPAYDRFFIDGMRTKGLSYSYLNPTNFSSVVDYFIEYNEEFLKAQKVIIEKNGTKYPAMKLVDMYFWNLGYKFNND